MRAGFKRSRTRARVYSLYFRSLCGSIIDQSKSCRNFSSEKGEESKFFEESFFFFSIDDRFGRFGKRKKMARDESCLAQGWIVLSHLPSPSLPPSLENRSAFSFTPLASRQRHWRESVPSPSSRSSLSLLLLLLRRGSRPSPPPRRRAFSHPAIGLPSGVRRERAGTYDAIGYRISAGSLIGRSTAHGRSRSPPSYD